MRFHRFIEKFNSEGDYEILDSERINQITKVLRLKIGDKIILTDGEGHEAEALIKEISKKKVVVEVYNIVEKIFEKNTVILYCAILKRENFELVVQKATELGVSSIVPILCERVVKQNLNVERLQKIIEEAVEQSGQTTMPTLEDITSFGSAIEFARKHGEVILFEQASGAAKSINNKYPISIFIGPEGGWSNEELEFAKEHGVKFYSLGPTTLRAETAAIVSSYVAMNL